MILDTIHNALNLFDYINWLLNDQFLGAPHRSRRLVVRDCGAHAHRTNSVELIFYYYSYTS